MSEKTKSEELTNEQLDGVSGGYNPVDGVAPIKLPALPVDGFAPVDGYTPVDG